MATGKRFYWIKLRDSFFNGENKAAIDFLMSQKNGANYVILYQMLCLMTANTGGVMVSSVGEMIIPYDPAKIQRDCKWFTLDTVIVALELFKKLGWVYEQADGVLRIVDFDQIVGSETDWAQKKARQREASGDNVPELSPPMSPTVSPQENREKSLEIREQISINHSSPAPACEQKAGAELISKGERSAALRQKYIGGSLGQGIVMMNDEQFNDLCERLSLDEMEKYFDVVTECEKAGKRYRRKTHYQAILDMAAKDRRCKENG